MARLAISCFGSFRAELDGAPLRAFESDKVRALLAYLAVESGQAFDLLAQAHPRAILADLLWPEQNEERARRSLSQALYNLRTVLGERNTALGEGSSEKAAFLLVTSESIRLNPGSDIWVDAAEFTRLIEAGGHHVHRLLEACPPCQERLQAAADLYRGDFLEGFSVRGSAVFEEWVLFKRERYRQDASRALASLAAYQERQGHTRDALQAARRLAELDPYDDGACQALMRLLAANSQRAEALTVYERFRLRLSADLEAEPEAETRSLTERLRRQKDASPVLPVHYTNLPASLSPLIGREAELAEVQQRLLDPANRLLTILGPGGSGKSRLALEVARGLLDRFADGVFLASLSPLVSLESFVPGIAAALGLQIQEKKSPMLQVQDYLRRKELLLVLDGCEGFLAGVPHFLELMRAAPDLKLLATSRARLNVEEEQVYQLGGLQYVSAADLQAAALCPAVRLFASGARRARPAFELDEHNLGAVAEICAEVQGMPLAILLAAAWVEMLSPADILAEVRLSLDFLQAEWADLPARQRSVRLTFDYSWNLLEDADRAVFRGLCVFRGAFTRQAAETVSGAGAAELRRLADKSLVMPQTGEWYAVHELLRQYGLEKLKENPSESACVHRRYSAYYLEKLAEWESGLKGARQVETLALMDAKINDLRLAWDLACEGFDVVHISCALESLCLYYQQRIRLKEGESACRFVLEKLEAAQEPPALHVQARLLAWQSRFYRLLGEHELSHQSLEKCRALLGQLAGAGLDLRPEQAMVLLESAEAIFTADLAETQRLLLDSLNLYRSSDDDWHIAGVLCRLGANRAHAGDFSAFEWVLGEALELYRALGYVAGMAEAQRILAHYQVRVGKLASALALMRQVILDSQAAGNRFQAAIGQRTLGVILLWNGGYAEALPLLQDSLVVADDLGDRYEMTTVGGFLGTALFLTGQYETSRHLIARSLQLARQNGFDREAAFCLWVLGDIELAKSTPQAARPYYLESVELYRQVGHQDELCWSLALDAFCLLLLGDIDEATRRLGEALEITLSIHGYMSATFSLVTCAVWLALQGKLELSLELYSLVAAQPLFVSSTWFADVFGKFMAPYTARLDPAIAEAARQRGLQRALQDTVVEMQARLNVPGAI